ncbi:hypothetical protein SAMN05216334_1424 [Nitrosomonas ureae]|uniref:Uncharacterized protein n=1 Tax=Nitrosomonas ureae TaxID=44577 RepID=A0A1H5YA98_9PROT|nr:hypothetical protein SAMN05216334_1424 [Nitrosomonas ureae]
MVNYMDAIRTAIPYLITILVLSWFSAKFMRSKKVPINK